MKKITSTIRQYFLMLALVCVGAMTARAATYTVMNNADSGAGSLRNAIAQANASSDNDTINFDASLAGQTILLTSGQLTIENNGTLTINGLGANQLTVSGNIASRVFFNYGANATINGITITGGNGVYNSGDINNSDTFTLGGGIYNARGTLNLTNSTVSGNSAFSGGGIYNGVGTVTLTNSTVSGNSASNDGGGVLSFHGTVTLTNSTVSGNSAGHDGGGGISNLGGTLNLTNSTVSGNSALDYGGGINNIGIFYNIYLTTATLTNSTVSNNSAPSGGGVYNLNAVFNSSNSIIADSTNGGDCLSFGEIGFQYSLIEDGSCGVMSGTNGNLTGDPLLGPLQNNGGPTFTHALLPGSIAIDAGNSTLATDQRGFKRPFDSPLSPNQANGADIGAFEYRGSSPTTKDQCKNGGWMTFDTPRTFKNQGECIQFVNTGR